MDFQNPSYNGSVIPCPSHVRQSGEDISKFRNSGPKSRNGCITCKVKCGEEKPECIRCKSTGRKCDGNIEPQPRKNSKLKMKDKVPGTSPRTNKHANTSPSAIVRRSPSVDIEGSLEERRSFHYFRSRNMSSMPGNFEPYFWDHLVLQFSHRDPTIRYSLIALSAIYEEHEAHPSHLRLSVGQPRSVYVLQQYTKALRHLADSLLMGKADPRVTLISCLIFIWIEFLQNNLESGFRHLESGLQILRDLGGGRRTNGCGSPCSRDFEDIYGSLDRSFKRLSIQATIHGRVSTFDNDRTSLTDPWELDEIIPPIFNNIFEARNYMDGMLNSVFTSMRQLRDSEKFGTPDQVVDLFCIDSICSTFLEKLENWQQAVQQLLKVHFGRVDEDCQPLTVMYLQLYHTYMKIILRTPFATSEMMFDGYTTEFTRIVELSRIILDRSLTEGPPVLSFDMGIIPPLFLLVLKCRDLQLRRKALELLRQSPEQEGLWRRSAIVAHSEWKIDFEERGRGNMPETAPLPESARIYQEHLRYDIRDGKRVPMLVFRRSSVSLTEPPECVEMSSEMQLVMDMGNMV